MSSSQEWLSAQRHNNRDPLLMHSVVEEDLGESTMVAIRTPLPSGISKKKQELAPTSKSKDEASLFPMTEGSPFEPMSMDPLGMPDAFPGEDLDKTVMSFKVPEMLLSYEPGSSPEVPPKIRNVASVNIDSLQKMRERSQKKNDPVPAPEKKAREMKAGNSNDDRMLQTVIARLPEGPIPVPQYLLEEREEKASTPKKVTTPRTSREVRKADSAPSKGPVDIKAMSEGRMTHEAVVDLPFQPKESSKKPAKRTQSSWISSQESSSTAPHSDNSATVPHSQRDVEETPSAQVAKLAGNSTVPHSQGIVERLNQRLQSKQSFLIGTAFALSVLMPMILSVGSMLMYNTYQQKKGSQTQEYKAAITQAIMLEKSIRTSMLEGRADIVRTFVSKLRDNRSTTSIEVIRPDRTYAYSDFKTRKKIEKRISDPRVLDWIEKTHPKMLKKIEELKRTAFTNIDKSKILKRGKLVGFPKIWKEASEFGQVKTHIGMHRGKKTLTVLWPIKNTQACQACHGSVGKSASGNGTKNHVTAVLVVRRSQEGTNAQLQASRWMTLGIGGGTSLSILFFLALFGKLFGIKLHKG